MHINPKSEVLKSFSKQTKKHYQKVKIKDSRQSKLRRNLIPNKLSNQQISNSSLTFNNQK